LVVSYWVEIIAMNDVSKTEDVKETDVSTYRFNHTMIRVKDINHSLDFYQKVCGMTLINTLEYPTAKFNLYFLCYPQHAQSEPASQAHREGILELTYNYGTEKDDTLVYHSGNEPPHVGFGHLALSVDDIHAACKRFEEHGIKFHMKPGEGPIPDLARIADPDGYHIEIIQLVNKSGKSHQE